MDVSAEISPELSLFENVRGWGNLNAEIFSCHFLPERLSCEKIFQQSIESFIKFFYSQYSVKNEWLAKGGATVFNSGVLGKWTYRPSDKQGTIIWLASCSWLSYGGHWAYSPLAYSGWCSPLPFQLKVTKDVHKLQNFLFLRNGQCG